MPYGYRAFPNVHVGPVEADVTEHEIAGPSEFTSGSEGPLASVLIPPPAYLLESIPADVFEIEIKTLTPEKKLVAVIELVSYANKHRETKREQFVAKCINMLRNDVGVIMIDIVTTCHINLHNEIIERFGADHSNLMDQQWTYVSSYRPTDAGSVEVWPYPALIGMLIPEVPIPIKNGLPLLVDLEGTYQQTLLDAGIVDLLQ